MNDNFFRYESSEILPDSIVYYNVISDFPLGDINLSNYIEKNTLIKKMEVFDNGQIKITKIDGTSFILASSLVYSMIFNTWYEDIMGTWKNDLDKILNMLQKLPYDKLIEIQTKLDTSDPKEKIIDFIIWMLVNENSAKPLNYTVLGQ